MRLHHCITDKGTDNCEQSASIQLLTLMHKEDPLVWGPSLLSFPFPSPPLFSGPKHQHITKMCQNLARIFGLRALARIRTALFEFRAFEDA
jgi:hypothetical protein